MGLDTVELVMAFEEAFGIDIPNPVAERLVTPRAVVDYVCMRVPLAPSGPCATQRTFYQLRRAMRAAVGDAADIRPGTRVGDLATRREWPVVWERVREAARSPDWPEVRWRRWPIGGPKTLRALTWRIVQPVAHPDVSRGEAWTRERIALRVRELVWDQVGVDDFSMRDEFVRDMGIE